MYTRKYKTIEALTLALSLTMGAACVEAATVSYSGSTGVAGAASLLQLQQFDPSLGILTAITIDWDSGFAGTYRVVEDTQSGTASAVNSFVTASIFNTAAPAGAGAPSLNSIAGTAFSASISPTYSQGFSGGMVMLGTQ